ncbi:MAG: alcohol dehydrogenase catalytic domain-containing protein, partial [Actinomycetota bacterium]|nr:alcohol dehydrogenase catalytic domain-containing protein [Actinomycetota bacterium]
MRAAVYLASGEVELRELPEPEPGPGELVVEVELCGICGSDLIEWYASAKAPGVLGHEPVGRVVTAGSSLNGVRMPEIGSRVFVHHHVPCGICDLCLAGRETLCSRFKETKLQPGGFAERILVSAEHVAKDVLVLPEEVSSEAATLIEPLACCIRGVRKAGIVPRSRVVIIGLGQVG